MYDQKSQRKTKLCSSNYGVSKIFAGKPQKSAVRAEIAGHSLRVGAAQDLLIKGYDLAAIMRAGGWSDPSTVSRYLRFSQHNIWK